LKRLSPAGLRAVAVVLIAISDGCAARAASHEAERLPLAVVVERARAAAPRAVFEGPGSVAPAHTYHLAFEVSGRITDVRADVGDRVRPGALLAAIDDRDFRAQVDAANARAAAAAANALRTTSGARPQERAEAADAVGAARAAVSRATAALALAAGNEARVRQLLSSGYVAAQQADTTQAATLDARAQLRSAQALLGAAQQREALVRLGPRDEDRTAATADATAARAGADVMRSSLAKTAVYAPADAFVESRSIELGDMASPGITAFTLTDAGTPDILVAVPEALVGRLRVGMPHASFATAPARRGRSYASNPPRTRPRGRRRCACARRPLPYRPAASSMSRSHRRRSVASKFPQARSWRPVDRRSWLVTMRHAGRSVS